ncbi:hypothetical protein [Stomatohabitans albus]|uniref:hypothetical protein n=1 Tax=Stomatohabitans albus TaxID=3110766 RepID=UPI00300CC643
MNKNRFQHVTKERIIGLVIAIVVLLIIIWFIVPRGGPVPDILPPSDPVPASS